MALTTESKSGEDNVLTFVHTVVCPRCSFEQDGIFKVAAQEVQDIKEPPTTVATCDECGALYEAQFDGFWQYGYG